MCFIRESIVNKNIRIGKSSQIITLNIATVANGFATAFNYISLFYNF